VSAGLLGLLVFRLALRLASNPMGPRPGWALAVGIVALFVGLVAASFLTWRRRWR